MRFEDYIAESMEKAEKEIAKINDEIDALKRQLGKAFADSVRNDLRFKIKQLEKHRSDVGNAALKKHQ